LLSIVPILCAELTGRFIDTAPGVNVDLRTLVIAAFGLCMLVLRIVLIPVYIAGIQILTAELARNALKRSSARETNTGGFFAPFALRSLFTFSNSSAAVPE